MTPTEELIESYIVLSTLNKAITDDKDDLNPLVRTFSHSLHKPVWADLRRVEQQLRRSFIDVKKTPGKPRYEAFIYGRERMVVEYTPQELKMLCEEKAGSYIQGRKD